MLQEKVRQLEDELELVQWYIQVMEQGKNAQNIIKDYYAALEKITKLNQKLQE